MSDLFCQTDNQMEHLRPFFFKSHCKHYIDDHRMLSGIIL